MSTGKIDSNEDVDSKSKDFNVVFVASVFGLFRGKNHAID